MIATVTCAYCKGSKVAEVFQECVGGEWRPIPAAVFFPMPNHAILELQEDCARRLPHAFRWADCPCPRCHGHGEYEVEGFACKIF